MRTRHLVILIVAAAVAILATLWTGSLREADHPTSADTLLAPGLEAVINDIDTMTVTGAKGAVVTLERGTEAWSIREKSGYPADTGKVRKLLIGLAQSRLLEQKTSNAQRYGELGVADLDAAPPADAKPAGESAAETPKPGVLVELKAPAGSEGLAFIIGNTARGATGTYVRKPGDTQSWLASGDLTVDADPLNWLDRQILNVAANRIQQVTLRHPDGETLVISKETREAPNYSVHDVPAKREVKYASVGNPVASTLASLRLEDVHMLAERDPAVHAPIQVEYRTFDGLVVTAQTYVEGDKHYVHFAAAFDEAQAQRFYVAPPFAADAEAATEGDATAAPDAESTAEPAADVPATTAGETQAPPAESTEEAAAPAAIAPPDFGAVKSEAETLNARVQPWVYVIGSYKYDQMKSTMADMLKEVEKTPAK